MIQKRDDKTGALIFHTTDGEKRIISRDLKQKQKIDKLEKEVLYLKRMLEKLLEEVKQ